MNGTIKRQYLECIFCNPEKIEYAEGTVGWRCTCMCSSTMAIQEKVEVTATSFSSDITLIVDTAARQVFKDKRPMITQDDLEKAINGVPPSVSLDKIRKCEKMRDKFMRQKQNRIGFN